MKNTASTPTAKISKKEARKLIFEKLSGALAEFKPAVKGRKFTNRLKKASKLFAADIAKTISKKTKPEKLMGKKKTSVNKTEDLNKSV